MNKPQHMLSIKLPPVRHKVLIITSIGQFKFWYYNLKPRNRSKEESCIGLIQENSIKFQLQSIYLIYTWLIVHIILNLAYSKNI